MLERNSKWEQRSERKRMNKSENREVKEKGWTRDGEDENNLPKVRWVSGGQESEEKIRFMILLSLYKGDIIIIKIILINFVGSGSVTDGSN
jgi:hypothetical protein